MSSFEVVAVPQASSASPRERLPKAAQSSRKSPGEMATSAVTTAVPVMADPVVKEVLTSTEKAIHFTERRQDSASLCLSDLARHDLQCREAVLSSETAQQRRRLPARPSQALVAAQAGGLISRRQARGSRKLPFSHANPGSPGSQESMHIQTVIN